MSRTYRRKNFEQTRNNSWAVRGFKTNGHYTASDGYWGWDKMEVFRPATKQERWEKDKWRHGESRHASERSPNRYHRNYREVRHRMRCKQEIIKFMKDPDYEPNYYEEPDSCLWDWS